jgi:hypothetical protein
MAVPKQGATSGGYAALAEPVAERRGDQRPPTRWGLPRLDGDDLVFAHPATGGRWIVRRSSAHA